MKKVLGILGAVVAFVALLIAMAIGKLAGRSAISQYNEAKQDQALADVLVNVNRGLPKMVDAMTRIDQVSVEPGHVIVYHYTLVSYPAPGQNPFEIFDKLDELKAGVVRQTCALPLSVKMLQADYAITYRYSDKNAQKLVDATIRRADCGR